MKIFLMAVFAFGVGHAPSRSFPVMSELITTQEQHVVPPALTAVSNWYKGLTTASGRRAQYNGTVGDGRQPLIAAYRQLSTSFQGRMNLESFEDGFAQIAHLQLMQAHIAQIDESAGTAEIFVEEERTMVFEAAGTPLPGIPAMAWYAGKVRVIKTQIGWQIDGFDLRPEDIISVTYGGHSPWHHDAASVAKVAAPEQNDVPCPSTATPIETVFGVIEIDICGVARYRVRLAKLHSGEWQPLNVVRLPKP